MLAQKLVGLAGMTIALTMAEVGTIAIAIAQPKATVLAQAKPSDEAERAIDEGRRLVREGSKASLTAAIQQFERALQLSRATGQKSQQASALFWSGRTYNDLGERAKALEYYNQSLLLSRTIRNRAGEAHTLNNIGLVYDALGEKAKALEYYNQSLPLTRIVGDRAGEATTLNNMGRVYNALGEKAKALEYYNQSLSLWRTVGDRAGEAVTLSNIGGVYDTLGEKAKALEYYNQTLLLSRTVRDRAGEARTLNNIGLLYDALGEKAKALEYYNQSLPLRRVVGDRFGEAVTLNNIGLAYDALGEKAKALEYYNQSLPLTRIVGDRAGEAVTLNNIGLVYNALGEKAKALEYYNQSLRLSRAVGDRTEEAVTLNNIGLVYDALGEKAKALEYYNQSLRLSRAVGDRAREANTLHNIGAVLKQQQPAIAIVFYKQSVNRYEFLRQEIRTLPRATQEAYTQSVAKTYRALADLLLTQDRILEAQQVLDLLKLQEFSDSLKDTRSAPQPLAFRPAEQQLLTQFNQQQQGAIVAAQDLKTLLDRPETQRSQQDRDRIRQLQQLQEAIAANFLQFIASPEVQTLAAQLQRKDSGTLDPQFLSQVQNKLGNQLAKLPQTALFYPLILDDRLELILITPDSAPLRRTVPIKRTDLNRLIANFSTALKDPSQDAKPSAQALYAVLIQPIAQDLKQANITTLLYSPDRRLRYVPLPALHDGNQWLLERLTINYITTASTTDLTTPRQPQPQVLAGAISDSRQQRYTVNLPQTQRQFLGLPNVSQELNGIAAQLPNTRTLRDRAFTADAVKSLFRQHNIFHFATHGSFERDRPELSFILFGDSSSDGKNYVTLQDIPTWQLSNADLVILSACETGLADDQFNTKADDSVAVMGMGYAFERAGAKATIASLWTVNDASTSALMQQFYANLTRATTTKSEALRQAQLALLNNKTQPRTKGDRSDIEPTSSNPQTRGDRFFPGYSHPYYWTPFILIGNGL